MAVWRYAGTLDDIWAGEMRAVNLGAVGVLLCNLDGTLVAGYTAAAQTRDRLRRRDLRARLSFISNARV